MARACDSIKSLVAARASDDVLDRAGLDSLRQRRRARFEGLESAVQVRARIRQRQSADLHRSGDGLDAVKK
jgi:hypothetical protein